MGEIHGESPKEPLHYTHEIDAQDLLESLGIELIKMDQEALAPQIIFADNQGAIKLSKNPQNHNRTKHIDVKYHFIRESS
jgi:hypothetical protein